MTRSMVTNVGVNTTQRTIPHKAHLEALAKRDEKIEMLTARVLDKNREIAGLRTRLANMTIERDKWHARAQEVPY